MINLQLFPGLIYRMVKPKVVLLIFVSGKVVLTGAKVSRQLILIGRREGTDSFALHRQFREEINEAFNSIYPVLTEFRK